MRLRIITFLAVTVAFLPAVFGRAQQTVTVDPYMAVLTPASKVLEVDKPATFDLFVMDSKSMAASEKLKIIASLNQCPSMEGMKSEIRRSLRRPRSRSHYAVSLSLPMARRLQPDIQGKFTGSAKPTTLSFKIVPGRSAGYAMEMEGMQMKGTLGNWSASREGSGTSWMPESSPMFMKMLPSVGGFELSTMGTIQAGYVSDGGKRGANQFFTDSMIMLMGRRETGGGTLGVDFMTSLDPVINGVTGVPDLFQTGETAHGVPIVDRQHPHNLFSELAASYSHPLFKDWSGFVYGGPVGEPALGNGMFLHRPSGFEVPEAPISHHWFDSTHISFGVITLGLVYNEQWKFEGSVFNGHEPGENRYEIGPIALNSESGRISYNPGRDWSLGASYGFSELTGSPVPRRWRAPAYRRAYISHQFANGDSIATAAYFGQNIAPGNQAPSNAWLGEATYFHARDSIFARFERVDKDELYNVPSGNYTINKLVFGDVHTFCKRDQLDYGVGAYAGVYSFPSSLIAYYGRNPITLGVFLRLRPGKM